MGQVHIVDRSNEAQATKGVDARKGIDALEYYRGYNHVLNIAQPVNGSPASQLISRDGASQLFNVPPANRFNESISQIHRKKSLQPIASGAYDPSNVLDDASQDENRNPAL